MNYLVRQALELFLDLKDLLEQQGDGTQSVDFRITGQQEFKKTFVIR